MRNRKKKSKMFKYCTLIYEKKAKSCQNRTNEKRITKDFSSKKGYKKRKKNNSKNKQDKECRKVPTQTVTP